MRDHYNAALLTVTIECEGSGSGIHLFTIWTRKKGEKLVKLFV